MTAPPDNLIEECGHLVAKADRALAAAHRDHEAGDYDFCSSRAYYAAYYALRAVLLSRQATRFKHSGNLSEFNRLFVKTGIFPKRLSTLIDRLFNERQIGDYEAELCITDEDAEQDLATSTEVVARLRAYLSAQGLLPGAEPTSR